MAGGQLQWSQQRAASDIDVNKSIINIAGVWPPPWLLHKQRLFHLIKANRPLLPFFLLLFLISSRAASTASLQHSPRRLQITQFNYDVRSVKPSVDDGRFMNDDEDDDDVSRNKTVPQPEVVVIPHALILTAFFLSFLQP